MRQHVLVPADRLAAACVMRSQTLILYAEGQAPNYTYDITFNRKAWEGGLRFELQGWWLPARGTLPYKAHKAFHIADIHAADPGGRALVVTANHPGGVLVPILVAHIHVICLDKKGSGARASAAAAAAPADAAAMLAEHGVNAAEAAADRAENNTDADDANNNDAATAAGALVKKPLPHEAQVVKIVTHVGRSFRISEPLGGTNVSHQTYVQLHFDRHVLALANAGVVAGQLEWTLRAASTGATQAIVLHRFADGARVLRKVYQISVVLGRRDLVATSAVGGVLARASATADNTNVLDADDDDDDDDDDEESEAKVTFDDAEVADDADTDDADEAEAAASGGVVGRRRFPPIPLPFLPSLRLALRIIEQVMRGTDAQLLVARADQPLPLRPTRQAFMLQRVGAIARSTTSDAPAPAPLPAFAAIECTCWGPWGRPVPHPPLDRLRAVDLDPSRKPLGIFAAQAALRKAGVLNAFWSVELMWPVVARKRPGAASGGGDKEGGDKGGGGGVGTMAVETAAEPQYVFLLEDKVHVATVDLWSGRVRGPLAQQSVHLLDDAGEADK